jgi:MoaD family protein
VVFVSKVKVKYFARLRELLNTKEEEYEVSNEATLTDLLLEYIPQRHSEVSKSWVKEVFRTVEDKTVLNSDGTPVLKNYLILVKGKTADLSYKLIDGDDVTVLPPAGGG